MCVGGFQLKRNQFLFSKLGKKKKKTKNWWGSAHLKTILGSLGGIGCGSGLLLLNSISWMDELGIGSRRLACPLPTPLDSKALRLGTLTNLFADLSFFFFCCIKNNTCREGSVQIRKLLRCFKLLFFINGFGIAAIRCLTFQ